MGAPDHPLNPLARPREPPKPDPANLRTDPMKFGPALLSVGALIFAVGGFTLALSASSAVHS